MNATAECTVSTARTPPHHAHTHSHPPFLLSGARKQSHLHPLPRPTQPSACAPATADEAPPSTDVRPSDVMSDIDTTRTWKLINDVSGAGADEDAGGWVERAESRWGPGLGGVVRGCSDKVWVLLSRRAMEWKMRQMGRTVERPGPAGTDSSLTFQESAVNEDLWSGFGALLRCTTCNDGGKVSESFAGEASRTEHKLQVPMMLYYPSLALASG